MQFVVRAAAVKACFSHPIFRCCFECQCMHKAFHECACIRQCLNKAIDACKRRTRLNRAIPAQGSINILHHVSICGSTWLNLNSAWGQNLLTEQQLITIHGLDGLIHGPQTRHALRTCKDQIFENCFTIKAINAWTRQYCLNKAVRMDKALSQTT